MGEVELRTGVLGVQYPAGPEKTILSRQQWCGLFRLQSPPIPNAPSFQPCFRFRSFLLPISGFLSAVLLD